MSMILFVSAEPSLSQRRNFSAPLGRKNILARLGAPIAVLLMALASSCGGAEQQEEDSTVEQEQFFATDPFGLEPGLAIVKMNHQGDGSFVVNLLSARQEETTRAPPIKFSGDQNGGSNTEMSAALADETGPVSVSRAVNIPVAGRHLFDVKADGPWTIDLEQPRPSSAPRTTSFSGSNDAATDFFELSSGAKTITMSSYSEKGSYDLSLLDEDDNYAGVSVLDKGEDWTGSGWSASWLTVDIPEEDIYLFNVQADSLWSIEIAEGEQPAGLRQPTGTDVLGVRLDLVIGVLMVPVVLAIIILGGLRGRAREHPGGT